MSLLHSTLNGFGVKLSGSAIEAEASKENFALKKHNLLQAMLAVNDMFYLASPMVSSIFYEDVIAWLDKNEIRYVTNVKFTGKSGLDHHFDFVIPKSKTQPDRFPQAIGERDLAVSMVGSGEVRYYAVLMEPQRGSSTATDRVI